MRIIPVLLLLCGTGAASAANIHIVSDASGNITLSWSEFDNGFGVNGEGPTAGSVTFTPNADVPKLNFSGSWISNGCPESTCTIPAAQQTLYFVDPGTTHVRSSLTATWGFDSRTASISGSFSTDTPFDLGDVPPESVVIPLTSSPQELVPTYLRVPENLTFQVGGTSTANTTSLGTTGTSGNPSGGTTDILNQTITQSVNTATGNTYVSFADISRPGKDLHFQFIRSYNDQDSYSGPLCRGWTHTYNILLTADASGTITIKQGDGHTDVYQPGNTPGAYVAPIGVYDVLKATGTNRWTLTRPDQTVLTFGPVTTGSTIIRLLSLADRNGNTETLSYDASGDLLSFNDIDGDIYNFTYNSGQLTKLQQQTAGAGTRTFTYACDAGNLITYQDPNGKTSHYSYDAANLLSTVTDADSNVAVANTFDSQGRTTSVVRRLNSTTAYTTTYVYDDVNHITTITDACGGVTHHYYDSASPAHLTRIVDALGLQTTFTYDANNNLTSITNPLRQTTSYTWDSNGNRTSITDPLQHTTSYQFALSNNTLTSTTDPKGNQTRYEYDGAGNLTRVSDALGNATSFTYDTKGNRKTFVNANGKFTSYTYDGNNRVTSITDPDRLTTNFTYDDFSRLKTVKEPAGNVKTLGYDSLGRTISVTYTKGGTSAAPANVSYSYDGNGNRVTMNDGTGATNYAYDALNRVTSIATPNGTVTYGYDCNDNRTAISYGGRNVQFGYDAISRLTTVQDGGQLTGYTYDFASNLVGIAYPNKANVAYSYDTAGRITQVTNGYIGSAGNPISSFAYNLDANGNRIQVTDGSGVVSAYTYDKLNRLTVSNVGGKNTQYGYDGAGNRLSLNAPGTSIKYGYDNDDRLTSVGTDALSYDANGNLISRGAGKSKISYTYDAADRLISASGDGLTASSFTYDGDGNRVSQQVGKGTYHYLNDIATRFTTLLTETGPDGNISYLRGRGLISASGSAFTYFYQYDAQSTVAGITDTTGHLAQRYLYDVFGERTLSTPGPQITTQNKFGYTGELLDPGTSLYYLRARYYDPTIGRFLNKDPFVGTDLDPQTLNRYPYVRNNPATLTDRTGRCSWDDGFTDCDLLWPGAPALP